MSISELNIETIESEISRNENVIVKFYSSTCKVCEKLAPVVEQLSNLLSNYKFYKINTENNLKVCMKYRVLSLPTILVFKNGNVVEKINGFKTKEELRQILEQIN